MSQPYVVLGVCADRRTLPGNQLVTLFNDVDEAFQYADEARCDGVAEFKVFELRPVEQVEPHGGAA